MESTAWLSLGANIGDPPAQLAEAIRRLDAHPRISVVAQSSVHITKPWGKTDQPDFANSAIAVTTDLKPLELLDIAQNIELEMGRQRLETWGPRVIDIDIIAFEHIRLISERLVLPHPYAHERDFVLKPLREIAPNVGIWLAETAARAR